MENLLTSSFKPDQQLVIYRHNDKSYIEHYEIIEQRDGKRYLSEGKPLTKETLKRMLDQVLTSDKSAFATVNKLLPDNILYCDARPGKIKLIWYTPAKEYTLIGINKRPVKAKLPGFIYKLEYDTLYIYATKLGNRKPELNTPLFHAPLPNVYEECKVCMGTVKKPKSHIEIADLIESWNKAFWGSEFTNHLWSEEIDKQLRASIRSKKAYPLRNLEPVKKTLKQIL